MNRKFIQSTGILLRNLHDDPSSNQIPQQQPASMQQYHHFHHQQPQQQHYHQMNEQDMHYMGMNMPPTNIHSSDGIYRYPKRQNPYVPQQTYPQATLQQQQQPSSSLQTNYSYRQNQSYNSAATITTQAPVKKPTSVPELPETFGVPIKRTSSIPKYTTTSNSETIKTSNVKVNESISAPTLTVSLETKKLDSEIEIIGEKVSTTSSTKATTKTTSGLSLISQTKSDETFRKYLSEKFDNDLVLVSKPQSNFVSNFECIDQITKKLNYDERKRPYCRLNNKLKRHIARAYNAEDSEDDSEILTSTGDDSNKVKKQKLIVIDDTSGDDTHKPWITPALINLIKQRNLLQSKLNETGQEPDPELVKKFKNLRNKVTKLVKNARKEYLAKVIKEKKDIDSSNDVVIEKTIIPVKSTLEQQTKIINTTVSSTSQTSFATNSTSSTSNSSTSITSAQSGLMMNLYNSFFNQYLQQYTQKRAQTVANPNDPNTLKEQAAFYAQQQLSIQTQLEQCLSAITQQYLSDFKTTSTTQYQQTQQQTIQQINQHTGIPVSQQQQQQQQKQQALPAYTMGYHYNK